jgi:hypothetical protein
LAQAPCCFVALHSDVDIAGDVPDKQQSLGTKRGHKSWTRKVLAVPRCQPNGRNHASCCPLQPLVGPIATACRPRIWPDLLHASAALPRMRLPIVCECATFSIRGFYKHVTLS